MELTELPATCMQGTGLLNTHDLTITGVQIWIWEKYPNLNLRLTGSTSNHIMITSVGDEMDVMFVDYLWENLSNKPPINPNE